MRLAGLTLQQITKLTGLSAPTVIRAYGAFLSQGWAGVAQRQRGRKPGEGRVLALAEEHQVASAVQTLSPEAAGLNTRLWTPSAVGDYCRRLFGRAPGPRALERLLGRAGLHVGRMSERTAQSSLAHDWLASSVRPLVREARSTRTGMVWMGQIGYSTPSGEGRVLLAQTMRGTIAWLPVCGDQAYRVSAYVDFLDRLAATWPSHRLVLLHGIDPRQPKLLQWLEKHPGYQIVACPVGTEPARPRPAEARHASERSYADAAVLRTLPSTTKAPMKLTHLQSLEAEGIHILREVVAECERPVMLYSIGKDSATMLHLAKKAFHPAPPPFPLLHVDTTWKFRDMYAMRERMAREMGMELLVWQNPEAKSMGINPFDHGSQIHTDMWKTQGLKQALDHYGFDAAFGGARRDEEKSRAKERIFSFRSEHHRWDPKNQRPELWNLYNARKRPGESIRVFPLSNWTELDIWQYIYLEDIPIVPLYLARERPVVERNGTLLMVDDERFRLEPDEVPVMRKVRFRTLGCYPLSGAVESEADTLPAIIQEMLLARTSERQGRMIDHDQAASMEKKKQEGYF